MKPLTRKEIFENAIAEGKQAPIEPVTREEMILAAHAKREASGGGTGGGKRTTAYIKQEYLWKDKECTEKFTKAELMEIGLENLIIEYRPEWDDYALSSVHIPYDMRLVEDYATVYYSGDAEVYSAEYVSTGA